MTNVSTSIKNLPFTNEELKFMNSVFFTQTTLYRSTSFGKKENIVFSFKNDPLTLVFITSKGKKSVEIIQLKNVSATVKKSSKYKYELHIDFYQGIEVKKLTLIFDKENVFLKWKTVLKILFKNKKSKTLRDLFETNKQRLSVHERNMTVKKGKGSIVSSTQSVVTRKNSESNVNTQSNNNCKDSCNIYVFGSNDWGQLCMGRKTRSIKVPKLSLPMISSKVRGASCGWGHSIIIVDSREIWQSGNRVGMADETDKLLPEKLNFTFPNPIEKVVCGNTHNIAIDDSGQIYTWGSNFFGELGHGDNMDIWKPKLVKDFENKFVTCVAAGDGFTLALLDDGSVYSWGSGLSGALGHGDRYDQLRPKKIESLDGVKIDLIEAGNHHVVAISNNDNNMESRFYSWGWNACGQLGNNTLEDSLVPIKSSFVIRGKVTSISCGVAHSALVSQIYKLQTNCLYMWGSNKSGQLGFPVMPKAEIFKYPTSIPLSINPYFVKCGGNQTYVATNDKKLYSTGDNYINQLGIVSDEVLEELGEEVSMKQSYKTTLNKADISKLRQRSMRKKTMSLANSEQEWTVVEGLSFDDTMKEPLSKTGGENNHILMLEKFEEVRLLRGKTIVDIASGNEFVMVLTSKEWIEDGNVDKCMGGYSKSCKQKFGVLKRRHHCRSCGGIFCSACSSNYLYLTADSNDRVRVCEKCFKHNISNMK